MMELLSLHSCRFSLRQPLSGGPSKGCARIRCAGIAEPSGIPAPMAQKTEYRDGVFEKVFMGLFARKMEKFASSGGKKSGNKKLWDWDYESFVNVSKGVMIGRTRSQQQEVVREVLLSMLPPGAPVQFRKLFPPTRWAAEFNAALTVPFFHWLVGPSEKLRRMTGPSTGKRKLIRPQTLRQQVNKRKRQHSDRQLLSDDGHADQPPPHESPLHLSANAHTPSSGRSIAIGDKIFVLVFHHGGYFLNDTNNYVNGKLKKVNCEEDKLSYFELNGIVEEDLGYKDGYAILWKDTNEKINLLKDDEGVLSITNGLTDGDEVHLYVEHFDMREEGIVGEGGPEKCSQVYVPCRSTRNFRASRAVQRKQATEGETQQQQKPKRTRGPNQAHRLRPNKSRGETTFPLFWTSLYRYTGDYAERFARYMGDESRHPKRYPLYSRWGETHRKSFDNFFIQAQEDYEWLSEPESEHDVQEASLDLHAIYDSLKKKMQEMIRGNRYTLKKDRYDKWVITPVEERAALLQSEAFSDVDKETWSFQCAYFESEEVKAQSKRNKGNRKSSLHGRATYTGGSRNMARAVEISRKKIKSAGGTPSIATDWLATHTTYNPDTGTCTYPDQATEKYCKLVQDELQVSGVGSSGETNPLVMTDILDRVHRGHRGGYERGLGVGVSRSTLKRTSTPAATQPTPREQRLEKELAAHKVMLEKHKTEMVSQIAEHQSQMAFLKAGYDELKKMVSSTSNAHSDSRETSTPTTNPSGASRQPDIQLLQRCFEAGLSSTQIMNIFGGQ